MEGTGGLGIIQMELPSTPQPFVAATDLGGRSRYGNGATTRPKGAPPSRKAKRCEGKWGREDSNLRRQSQRVYSPSPLAAREHPLGSGIVAGAIGTLYRQNLLAGVLRSQR